MISDTIARKSITNANRSRTDMYAPLLDFSKYTKFHFGDNSCFILKVSMIGYYEVDTCEIYITTGYDYELKQSYCTAKFLTQPKKMKFYIYNGDEVYRLYGCTNTYNTKIVTQVIYANNISYIEPISFKNFTVNKANQDVERVIDISIPNAGIISDNTYTTSLTTTSGSGNYTKLMDVHLTTNPLGCAFDIEFLQNSNGNTQFGCGKICCKARYQDENGIVFQMHNVYGNVHWNKDNINIIAVKTTWTNQWTLYLEIKQAWTSYMFKSSIHNFNNKDIIVNFYENQGIITSLPEGAQTILF